MTPLKPYNAIDENFELLLPQEALATFLVGAGISMEAPSNAPSAWAVVKTLLECAALEDELDSLMNDSLRYEYVIELIQKHFDKDLVIMEYFDLLTEPNLLHLFLAHALRQKHLVLTTNFDYLIEYAFKKINAGDLTNLVPIISQKDYLDHPNPTKLSEKGLYPLIKVHGSKKNVATGDDTTESLVTTISAFGRDRQEGEIFAIESYKKLTVNNAMQNRTLIVMGYSGGDDFDISPLLKGHSGLKRLIWIDHVLDETRSPEYYEFVPPIDLDHCETSTEQLLGAISNSNSYPVYYIKAHTAKFVEQTLSRLLLPDIPLRQLQPSVSSAPLPDYAEIMRGGFKKAHDVQKSVLTALLYYDLENLDAAIRCCNLGIKLSEEFNQAYALNALKNLLGFIYIDKGLKAEALAIFQEIIDFSQEKDELWMKGTALHNVAVIYKEQKQYDLARRYFSEALAIAEQLGQQDKKAITLRHLGVIAEQENQLEKALDAYQQALKCDNEVGSLYGKARTSIHLGEVLRKQSNFEEALEHLSNALEIFTHLEDSSGIASATSALGSVYFVKRDFERASDHFLRALQMYESIGNLSGQFLQHKSLGSLLYVGGYLKEALRYYQLAINVAQQLNDPYNAAEIIHLCAQVSHDMGDFEEAFRCGNGAKGIYSQFGYEKEAALIAKDVEKWEQELLSKEKNRH
ncbi:MAG: tetratricopeptide repeat protein [Candidatus Thorarchaeota archaeon]